MRKCFSPLVAWCTIIFFISCNHFQKNSTHQETPDASIAAGQKLAAIYCASCHQLPEPSSLDAYSWEHGVLPQMGPRLGIFFYGDQHYPSFINDYNIGKSFYPSQPLIATNDWQHIIDYYTATSPDSLKPASKPIAVQLNEQLFKPITPSYHYPKPSVLFTKIEENKGVQISDAITKKLLFFNRYAQVADSINIKASVTDAIEDSANIIVCNVGVLNPNNGRYGLVERINKKTHAVDTLFRQLMRPVQVIQADISGDKQSDYVVCEFGNLKGALSWYEQTDTGYKRHVLRAFPGAIKAYIDDYNLDGKPDIWALFAQGNEGVFLFTNKGNGAFDTKQVLGFPPYYGSSSFELHDFNGDGFKDILYTCGDNADYSTILKPYHGVYIFINDGTNNFKQAFFYPINGCYKAIAQDFDGDGDLDIATIAFFADYKRQPEEGFVYFKNESTHSGTQTHFAFKPFSLAAAKQGRWLTMDAGDWDGDGKTDLVLGNFSVAPAISKSAVDWTQQAPFLILKNMQ